VQIPVNKDIDDYKDDFFKGMTLRQTTMCVLTLAVGVGCYFLCNGVLRLPQTVSLYLVFPAALPFAAAGFVKIDGVSPFEYLKRRRAVTRRPLYRYQPLVFREVDASWNLQQEMQPPDGLEKPVKPGRIKKKERKNLLGPYEGNGEMAE